MDFLNCKPFFLPRYNFSASCRKSWGKGGGDMRYGAETRGVLCQAAAHARRLGHSYVGCEHLLLAVCGTDGWPGRLLCGAGLHPLMADSAVLLLAGFGSPAQSLHQGWTPGAEKVLRMAAREAKCFGCREVGVGHLLLALLRGKETCIGI